MRKRSVESKSWGRWFALLSLCCLGGCRGGEQQPRMHGQPDSTADAKTFAFGSEMKAPLPHERESGPAPQVVDGSTAFFAYCSVQKWATCGVVLDDGRMFVLSGMPGARSAKSGSMPASERQKLADSINSERFFEFPAKLQDPNILDGSQSDLFAASPTRGYATENYSYPSASYARVADALSNSCGRAAQSASDLRAALAAVRAYAEQRGSDQRGVIAKAWLGDVARFGIAP